MLIWKKIPPFLPICQITGRYAKECNQHRWNSPLIIIIWQKCYWNNSNFLSLYNSKVKGKVCPATGHEGPEWKYRYSSTLPLTLAPDEGGWLMPHLGHFTTEKETLYPLYRNLGGPQGQSAQVGKISPPAGFDPQTVQPVVSHCTNWAILAHTTQSFNIVFPS